MAQSARLTRSRSEAGITGCSVEGSSRLGVVAGKRVGVRSLGVNADKGTGVPSLGVNAGKRVGMPSRSRVPNFFVTRATSSTIPSARRRRQRSPAQLGRGDVAVLVRAVVLEFRD